MNTLRPKLHITPRSGWINDPNGFCYFKGQYHLFAQHNPYGLSWGPMHWLHFVSKDLLHFEEVGVSLAPDSPWDKEFGCFSGSAIVHRDALLLYYTGVNGGKQTQCLAYSLDGIHFEKYRGNPLLDERHLPEGYLVSDFRDPKVFEKDGILYLLLSCRHEDGRASVLLFKGEDPVHFSFVGVVADFTDLISSRCDENGNPLRGMCECPDILFFGDRVALIVSLQFKKREGLSFQNVHSVVYALGKLDFETGRFVAETAFQEFDSGFDLYATQTLQKDGESYLVYWENMWDDQTYPDRGEGYCGALSSVYEVSLENNRLKLDWGKECKEQDEFVHLRLSNIAEGASLELPGAFSLAFSPKDQQITIIRQGEIIRGAEGETRNKRTICCPIFDEMDVACVLDRSCAEFSFNGGMARFTMRIYGFYELKTPFLAKGLTLEHIHG